MGTLYFPSSGEVNSPCGEVLRGKTLGRATGRGSRWPPEGGARAYLTATASISNRAPLGSSATWTQERAGASPVKYSA